MDGLRLRADGLYTAGYTVQGLVMAMLSIAPGRRRSDTAAQTPMAVNASLYRKLAYERRARSGPGHPVRNHDQCAGRAPVGAGANGEGTWFGVEPVQPNSAEAFGTCIRREIARWTEVVTCLVHGGLAGTRVRRSANRW